MEHSSMVDVKTYRCFPTSIHEVKLNIDSLNKKQMLEYVQLQDEDDDLHRMSYFRSLADKVLEYSEKILKDGGYEFDKIEITNMWGNLLSKKESHPPHTHSNNIFSGVYYLRASDQTAPIQFFDPRPQASVFKPRNRPNWNNSSMVQFDSVEGKGFIFPSWLMHWVPPTNGERVSVSWNIIARGDYGEPKSLQNANI